MIAHREGLTRRETAVSYLKGLPLDRVVTYDELRNVLGGVSVQIVQQVVNKAVRDFEEECALSLANERGVGYRIVGGDSQIKLARRKQKRGAREVGKASHTAEFVNMSLVPADQQEFVKKVQTGMARMWALTRMTADRVALHDEQLREITKSQYRDRSRQRATEAELMDVKEQMRKQQAEMEAKMEELRRKVDVM